MHKGRMRFACIAIFSAALVSGAIAQPTPAPKAPRAAQCTNGCGPDGLLGALVPDDVFGCEIKEACDQHDICYGRCDEQCGDLPKNMCKGECAVCDTATSCPPARRKRKVSCDTALKTAIEKKNGNTWVCNKVAAAYAKAVSFRGCKYFRGFRPLTEEARREFLREEFRRDYRNALKQELAAREQGIDTQPDRAIEALVLLSQTIELEEYALAYSEMEGRPQLAVVPKHGTGHGFAPSNEPRTLLNGIDVTEVRVDGKPFDLKQVISSRPSLKGSDVSEEVVPPK